MKQTVKKIINLLKTVGLNHRKNPEITIIGFPKCGTTALLKEYSHDSDFKLLYHSKNNKVEMIWPRIQKINVKILKNKIIAHKYAHYIYNLEALSYLSCRNSRGVFVVLVRNPIKTLISWHNMHRRIATSTLWRNHGAYRERKFYASCSLDDYYYKHAEFFKYDFHLNNALSIIPNEKLVVVSQEKLSVAIDYVAHYTKSLARGNLNSQSSDTHISEKNKHFGYADRATVSISNSVIQDLDGISNRLNTIINQHIIHKII